MMFSILKQIRDRLLLQTEMIQMVQTQELPIHGMQLVGNFQEAPLIVMLLS